MLRILYTTDLHGDQEKYQKILETALQNSIQTIHLGADILSKGQDLAYSQRSFIGGFLKEFFQKCTKEGIQVLSFFGNDDLYCLKPVFREYGELLDEKPRVIEGYTFKAYGMVPDYPFGLKTACKLDDRNMQPILYRGRAVHRGEDGEYEILDRDEYFRKKGTIEEDLRHLGTDTKTVWAMHCPPSGLELDVCGEWAGSRAIPGRRVGSKSLHAWIEQRQPLAVLCGHIHESAMFGQWKGHIGKTLVIQPGQLPGKTSMVILELEEQQVRPYLLEE